MIAFSTAAGFTTRGGTAAEVPHPGLRSICKRSAASWRQHALSPCKRPPAYCAVYAQPERAEDNSAGNRGAERTGQSSPSSSPVAGAWRPQTTSAKQRLLDILASPQNLETQRSNVLRHIQELERVRATPITEAFTELALAGEWHLLFSSTPTRPSGNIRVRRIVQAFDPENKTICNHVLWSYTAPDRSVQVLAVLTVESTYKFVGPGRLNINLVDHKVKINAMEKKDNATDVDVHAMILELQRTLPADFFDPSGDVEVSYVDPDFRIATFVGERLPGTRNVFVRRDEGKPQMA